MHAKQDNIVIITNDTIGIMKNKGHENNNDKMPERIHILLFARERRQEHNEYLKYDTSLPYPCAPEYALLVSTFQQ